TLLEQRISGPAIVAQARDKQLAVAQAGDVYHLALAGNLVAKQIIKRVSTQIGQAIQWLFMMYDVEKVVLGGGVTRVGDAFLAPILTTLARLRTQSLLNQKLLLDNNLMLAPSGFNAGLNGAVQLAMKGKMERNEE
ncbi:MAG: ROK family protein, partial [Candidatus Promineifilaceae bacterium]